MLTTVLFPLNWLLSFVATLLRLGAGGSGSPDVEPAEPLILYEFEGCPFCRITREQVSETGVTVHVKPCPKGGKRFRPDVTEKGGKAQFPYLIDPNAKAGDDAVAMYESADIARYLRERFGGASRPLIQWTGPINHALSQFAVLARYMSGTIARPASAPEQPLRFYACERSPGGRLIKEMLCSKELEYIWTSRASGRQATPLLEDPQTGSSVIGALPILDYLRQTYPRAV
ncbi:MAG: glutathione S-transferase N-terminal domain-containing protein [Pseudomonadota bacterium]